ncbi:hypothetical protein [[Mycoplasma] mobile]|uniref:Expressed protein n=1 Tax=Mycoplasma mobile (strain ATCC 43663 / 163K / NCTC 11711) TaxID=267748 RepID=Q6KHH1_MYCM1|nr:hypothetical protein [[Mycoplasma] mobile]AAT27959.1 expressed protein [Mycoplasma mobile 163K]
MITIGLPILFLVGVFFSFLWQIMQSRKGNLSFKLNSSWLLFNILFLLITTYILITNIINSINGNPDFNIINIISERIFGFSLKNGNIDFTWIIWIIFWFLFTIGIASVRNAIKISVLSNKIDELNRSVAITKGKLNKTVQLTSNSIDTNELSLDEFNTLLKNKLEKESALIKANTKLEITKIKETKKLEKLSENKN